MTGRFYANNLRNCPLCARAYIGRAYHKKVQNLRAVGINPPHWASLTQLGS